MTNSIVSSFKEILDHVNWMDNPSRMAIHAKAEKTISKVAYPENIFNNSYLFQLYKVSFLFHNLASLVN